MVHVVAGFVVGLEMEARNINRVRNLLLNTSRMHNETNNIL